MILWQVFTSCNQIFRKMSLSTKKSTRKTTGMNVKMKTTTITRIKTRLISKAQGTVINSWGTTRSDREPPGNLINSSMDMSLMRRGQTPIIMQRKFHPSMNMIPNCIMLFRLHWQSNQIWTSWLTRKIIMIRSSPLHLPGPTKLHQLPKMEVYYSILRARTSHLLVHLQLSSQRPWILSKSEQWWCRTRENSWKISLPHRILEPRKSLSKPKKIQLWRIYAKRSYISKMESNCTN